MTHPQCLSPHLLLGAGLLCISAAADAAWVVEPSAQVETSYDDNVRMRPDNEEDGIVTSANLQARLRNITEASEISLLAGGSLIKYSGVDSFSDDLRETLYLNFSSRRSLERGSFGLNGSFNRQDLLRNIIVIDDGTTGAGEGDDAVDQEPGEVDEFEPPLEDDLITEGDVDLRAVEQLTQRDRFGVNPYISYNLNQRTSATLSYNYSEINFDDAEGASGLQDNKSHSASFRVRREFSERNSGSIQVRRSRFEPQFSSEVDSWDTTLGWQRQVTERIRFSLEAGGRRTERDADESSGVLVNLRLDRRTERGNAFAIVERSLLPSGFGNVVETDRLTLGIRDQISDRLSWSLRGNAFSTDDSTSSNFDRTQDYLQISPELRWAISERWSVSGSYRYSWVDRERDTGSASRNSVALTLIFAPPRRF